MKPIFILLCSLFCITIFAQNFSPQVISISENPNPTDFTFLKHEIKESQVVMLGELTHSDGNVFEMKTKIVEYLVKEMGFTTIAFESGIYDVWDAQKKINKGEEVKEVLENSLFPIWGKTQEF